MAEKEVGENGFPLEHPAEPATVPFVVRVETRAEQLAEQLGVELETLQRHNGELLGGWKRHPRTGVLTHERPVPAGTIVHLPLGTKVPEDQDQEQPEPARTPRAKPSA